MQGYIRYTNSGHKIDWVVENDECCCEALVECEGTEISSKSEAKSKCPIEVDNSTAKEIKQIYNQKKEERDLE